MPGSAEGSKRIDWDDASNPVAQSLLVGAALLGKYLGSKPAIARFRYLFPNAHENLFVDVGKEPNRIRRRATSADLTDASIKGRADTLNRNGPELRPGLKRYNENVLDHEDKARFIVLNEKIIREGRPIQPEELLRRVQLICEASTTNQRDPNRTFPDAYVKEAAARQRGKCLGCNGVFDQWLTPCGDHIIPWASGGPTTVENCAALCHGCNTKKGTRSLTEFIADMRHLGMKGRTL